jgi:hypothetical protein
MDGSRYRGGCYARQEGDQQCKDESAQPTFAHMTLQCSQRLVYPRVPDRHCQMEMTQG